MHHQKVVSACGRFFTSLSLLSSNARCFLLTRKMHLSNVHIGKIYTLHFKDKLFKCYHFDVGGASIPMVMELCYDGKRTFRFVVGTFDLLLRFYFTHYFTLAFENSSATEFLIVRTMCQCSDKYFTDIY